MRGSEMDTFQYCRRKWYYQWVENLEPDVPEKAPFIGTVMHKFYQGYNETKNAMEAYDAGLAFMHNADLWKMDQVVVNELNETYNDLTEQYVAYWEPRDTLRTTIATELKFWVQLGEDVEYEGTIDHMFLDENGDLWLEDYKNVKSIEKYSRVVDFDRQITRYLLAATFLSEGYGEVEVDGKRVPVRDVFNLPAPKGLVYSLVSKNYARPPKILKDGSVSVDKRQHTTFDMYMQAIATSQPTKPVKPDHYDEILAFLQEQETDDGNQFFRRIKTFRTIEQLDSMRKEIVQIAHDLEEANERGTFYRNYNHSCAYCTMRHLCFAEANGEDASYIRETMYRVKTSELEVEDDEESPVSGDIG